MIEYRFATFEDAYQVAYVAAHSWYETYKGFMPDEYLENRIKNIDESAIKTKNFILNNPRYLVATYNEKVVGICYYSESQNNDYPNSGLLGALYVLKEYQGKNIGKNLFKMAIKNLKEMGFNSMYLECLQGNKTINFYKHFQGIIVDEMDYPISNFKVKADIVYFENLDKILEQMN